MSSELTHSECVKRIWVYSFAYEYDRLLGWLGAVFGKPTLYGQVSGNLSLGFQTCKEKEAGQVNTTSSPKKGSKFFIKSKPSASSSPPLRKCILTSKCLTNPSIIAVLYMVNTFSYAQQTTAVKTETAISFNIMSVIVLGQLLEEDDDI
ncbi:hypothetical protein M413DRAFT_22980 [Hebeloma cylindrosporum]|uniref:Uncharacterized protein n=1 Tax=Hebeloma cylindrosporum TaxID=76867 RepID=A0A0C2Z5M0_HEBCY|nr:hypothetical protein M413DRAFT_22980 [Hebeloma cylindrosporum h7]